MLVDRLKIHCMMWRTVMFGGYYHPAGPLDRGVHWYTFYHTQGNVMVDASLDIMYPMSWYLARCMDSNWFGIFINKQA